MRREFGRIARPDSDCADLVAPALDGEQPLRMIVHPEASRTVGVDAAGNQSDYIDQQPPPSGGIAHLETEILEPQRHPVHRLPPRSLRAPRASAPATLENSSS